MLDTINPWAHLEFAKGFVMFNHTASAYDCSLHQYYETLMARRRRRWHTRLSHPTMRITLLQTLTPSP